MCEKKPSKNLLQQLAWPNVALNKKLIIKLKKQMRARWGRQHLLKPQYMRKD